MTSFFFLDAGNYPDQTGERNNQQPRDISVMIWSAAAGSGGQHFLFNKIRGNLNFGTGKSFGSNVFESIPNYVLDTHFLPFYLTLHTYMHTVYSIAYFF